MYVGTSVRPYVRTYIRMYVHTYVRITVCTYVRRYVRMYVCTYVCRYVRMYVCIHVFMYTCIHEYMSICSTLPETIVIEKNGFMLAHVRPGQSGHVWTLLGTFHTNIEPRMLPLKRCFPMALDTEISIDLRTLVLLYNC